VEEMLRRREDKALLRRLSSFINELALSKEAILEEVLGVELLEGLAQDPELAATLYPQIVPEAKLRPMEREMYGRSPKPEGSDMIEPCEVLARMPNTKVHVLWKDKSSIR
jgi:hypothetical protein